MPKRNKRSKTQHGGLVNCEMPKRNKRSKTQHGGLGCDIPVDLLIEILSRLPGSSLSRFRFVSKQWGTLINTNPHLQKLHLDLGFKSGSPIILVHSYKPKVTNHITLISETGEPKSLVTSINKRYNRVSPSCNGLICVYNNFSAALVNPTTRQKRVLPKPPTSSTAWEWHHIFLGYTPTKKYKLVRFYHPGQCEILTVGSCSWRQIDVSFKFLENDFKFWESDFTGSVVLNGVMYLMAQSLRTKIVSFDLNDEKFDTIESPLLGKVPSIFELEGKICVAYYGSYQYDSMEIWMLESIRSRAWNRKYKLMNPSSSLRNFQPVLIQGKVLVSSDEILNYCDAKTGVWAGSIYQEKSLYKLGAQFHFESFVNLQTL